VGISFVEEWGFWRERERERGAVLVGGWEERGFLLGWVGVWRGEGWASVVRISSGDVRGKGRTGELLAKTVLFEKNMRILLTLKNRAVYLSVIFF